MIIDQGLLQFATDVEKRNIKAVEENGSFTSAAKALGLHKDRVRKSIRALEMRAALRGYAPQFDMTKVAPNGFGVNGTSTLYKEDGSISVQWVKTKRDEQVALEQMRAVIEAMREEIPKAKAVKGPTHTEALLANLYTITDFHLGAAVKAIETDGRGTDWNLQIAEDLLFSAMAHLVNAAPAARVGILNQLGDLLHSDSLLPVTPTSGHVVDQDGRYTVMVRVVIRVLRRVIALMLTKHSIVQVIMAEGNHDMASSVWLRELFATLYEDEPRVSVDQSELPYYAYQHGEIFLGFHHGHKKNKESLPGFFAAAFRKMWGLTTKAYLHTGHFHHQDEKEFLGAKVIQHPTMSAPDSHTLRGGWMSEREMTVMTYHEKFGCVARTTVTPEMLEAA
jgi:DNA-binding Lrp family transcriptional regulator